MLKKLFLSLIFVSMVSFVYGKTDFLSAQAISTWSVTQNLDNGAVVQYNLDGIFSNFNSATFLNNKAADVYVNFLKGGDLMSKASSSFSYYTYHVIASKPLTGNGMSGTLDTDTGYLGEFKQKAGGKKEIAFVLSYDGKEVNTASSGSSAQLIYDWERESYMIGITNGNTQIGGIGSSYLDGFDIVFELSSHPIKGQPLPGALATLLAGGAFMLLGNGLRKRFVKNRC